VIRATPGAAASPFVGVVVQSWGSHRVVGNGTSGCEIEGASVNLFQYLERESKELALRWTQIVFY